ncbi:MAG TPA: glutamyl-tRNA reductase [Candidatus Polarisedimenticolaceae bacterium]|nr:glutamyl-tRNA reductase [Candidatus Polarisedimenticolaceae bacterium]
MLTLVGMNHRSAPLSLREQACFPEDGIPAALARLRDEGGAAEALIVATCNRVEILTRTVDGRPAPEAIRAFLARERGIAPETVEQHVYVHEGLQAAHHVFAVACGLDSMVLGEPQILGQVKRAYALAREAHAVGPVLDRLMQHALAAAKRVRTATGISRHAVSVAYAASTLARTIFDDLEGCSVLLMGAGKMSELAARHLESQGVRDLTVTNRTYARALDLATSLGGRAVPWDERQVQLSRVDIVVTGTAATQPVVLRSHVKEALRSRKGRPLFIVDIAVPRDVEPSAGDLDGVYLYDVDDLQDVVDAGLNERRRAAEEARRMLDAEVVAFDRWRQAVDLSPTIAALRQQLHQLGHDEIERFHRRLGSLSPEQHAVVEELARSLIQKVLHTPIMALKSAAERGEAAARTALYREIFGLDLAEGGNGDEASGPTHAISGGKDE